MSALTADALLKRRGSAASRNEFGYPLAPGVKVFRGSLVGLNAAGQIQRVQDAGTVVFLGLADRALDNSLSSTPSPTQVVPAKGCWGLTVPNATFSNIGQPVYAVDDGTLTLTQVGSAPLLLQAGVLAGIETSATFVSISGS